MCNILLSKENSRKSIEIRQPVSGVYTAAGFYLHLLMCRHGETQQLQGRHKGSSRSNTLCENMEDHKSFPPLLYIKLYQSPFGKHFLNV